MTFLFDACCHLSEAIRILDLLGTPRMLGVDHSVFFWSGNVLEPEEAWMEEHAYVHDARRSFVGRNTDFNLRTG